MNRVVEILSSAKEAFIQGDHNKVIALLLPLRTDSNPKVAGTACYIGGLAYFAMKEQDKALALFQEGVDMKHDDNALYEGYGATLQQNAQYDKAEEIYNKGIEICGRIPTLLSHLSSIHIIRGHISIAEDMLKEALRTDGENYMGWTNLGNLFQLKGHYRDAVQCYKEALTINPHYDGAIANILLTSNYTRLPKEEVFQAHKTYCNELRTVELPKPLFRQKNKKIRIGYLSGDFKTHSVSYFFAPILQSHNRTEFEIFCYSDVYSPDPVTLRFQKQSDQWRDISRLSDQDAGRLMIEDNIDILVELTGHAGSRRLSLLKSKPVPVQITYLGYPNTLGIDSMDYRIVDSITDPEGNNDQFYVETLKRINGPFLSYMPSNDIPAISESPEKKNGFITFGSCNNLAKLCDETVELWSRLLLEVHNSKLYIKSKPLIDPITSEEIYLRFEHEGITRDRLILEGHRSSNKHHLEAYNEIDIALDCFPYNGTTTTCEALIMGVPVLTTLGDRHASRVSASILTSVQLESMIAQDADDFVNIGKLLANDSSKREELRMSLRTRMKSSPLLDGNRMARELERVYREVLL